MTGHGLVRPFSAGCAETAQRRRRACLARHATGRDSLETTRCCDEPQQPDGGKA